jgi:hypothetical protein
MDIFCVKVKQLQLGPKSSLDYFPFDRVYIVPAEQRDIALKLFRYSIIMDMNTVMYDALVAMRYSYVNKIPINRPAIPNPVATTTLPEDVKQFKEGDWLIVVPTYLQEVPIAAHRDKPPTIKTRLGYTLTRSITHAHNLQVKLPTMMLHTPKKDVPVICAICTHVPDYYVNTCHPGSSKCRKWIDLTNLPVDTQAREWLTKSIMYGGEIA